jgi:phage-related baseplate assembly protein
VRAFATARPASIVTDADYVEVAGTFAHPVYGAVAKAIATIRTGLNANLIELYILAQGADGLVTPSLGLKLALQTYIDEYNILTDTLSVLGGAVKPIEVDMTVVVNRNADASFVRTQVKEVLDAFFATTNREMGQALYVTDITEIITAIDGVLYVDLFRPTNNILPTGLLGGEDPTGVGVNEIIVETQRNIRIYYEKGRT